MIVACWSGPRNISTALMRSWSSRKDTFVTDEPFYAYYLKQTKLKHPQYEEIINHYPQIMMRLLITLLIKFPKIKKFGIRNIWLTICSI